MSLSASLDISVSSGESCKAGQMMRAGGETRTYQGVHILKLHNTVLYEQSSHQVQTLGCHLSLLVVGGDVEVELEADELTHGPRVRDKLAQQRYKELVVMGLTLKTLKNDVQNTVGIKIEISNHRLDHFDDVGWRHIVKILYIIYQPKIR